MTKQVDPGFKGKLYYQVGGQSAGSNYTELKNVRDVTIEDSMDESDVTTRENEVGDSILEAQLQTVRRLTISFQMVKKRGDEALEAIRNAYLNRQLVAIQVRDYENGPGLQFDAGIFTFTGNQPLAEGQTADVTIRPTLTDDPPQILEAV